MIKILKMNTLYTLLMVLLSATIIVGINGCKKKDTTPDTTPDTTGTGGGGTGGGGTTNPDYFQGNGFKVTFTNPTRGTKSKTSTDEDKLTWKGNGTTSDTSITLISFLALKEGTVVPSAWEATIKLNSTISFIVKDGTCTCTKENGLFVYKVVGATGKRSTGVGSFDYYPNINFKMTWPQ